MIELISILTNKDNYYRFRIYIKDYTLPKETKLIINDFDEYFKTNTTVIDIDMGKFSAWFLVLKHSSMKPAQSTIYQEIFNNVDKANSKPHTSTAEEIVELFVERDYATRLANLSLKVAEGDQNTSMDECEDTIQEYRDASKRITKNETLVNTDLTELYKPSSDGLNWRLSALNKSLGPIRKGDLIVVGKLPESGGTALVLSEMSFMITQLKQGEKILYFGNEERGEAVHKRLVSSVINRNSSYIQSNLVDAAKEFHKLGGTSIMIHAVHGRNINTIDRVIKQCENVKLIVIDQLWKVNANNAKGTNDVTRITNLFVRARELASKYAPVIAVHQADGTAYGNVYVGMEQLYMSRIGIQGEADAIVTVGVAQDDATKKHIRYINIPKNKLDGGKMSEERFRHGKFEVKIIPEVSRYND